MDVLLLFKQLIISSLHFLECQSDCFLVVAQNLVVVIDIFKPFFINLGVVVADGHPARLLLKIALVVHNGRARGRTPTVVVGVNLHV